MRILVKIGSNVLSTAEGLPDPACMGGLVRQLTDLWRQGHQLIVVSSGAVAFGRSMIRLDEHKNTVKTRQLLSAVGQVRLMATYESLLNNYGIRCAQVLVTKEDFRDRSHYLNMRTCMETLLSERVIPIINENDVTSVTELMFTDNDELAGLISAMLDVEEMVILSNVDGLYRDYGNLEKRSLVTEVNDQTSLKLLIEPERSAFGRGGMLTKANTAKKIARLGVKVHIANGKKENVILETLAGTHPHTTFLPERKVTSKKKWVAHAEQAIIGEITINQGAELALKQPSAVSLLPVGMIGVTDNFRKGDVVRIVSSEQRVLGWGIAGYSGVKAREYMGQKRQPAIIHYDHLYLINEVK